jgi:glycosyltransferase involved in cell wall biosynthesis
VVDLARAQAARGHRVGIVADAMTGGEESEAVLADLAAVLALGITRVRMSRQIGPPDMAAVAHVSQRAAAAAVDVLHGHGAKGGAYARLARCRGGIRVYTPHGGSLHYRWSSPTGLLYLTVERLLIRRTHLFLFESAYGRDVFRHKVGDPGEMVRVVHNGVAAAEFAPVAADARASDIVFVGELRALKGVAVLIEALALLAREGREVSATIVGEGPDRTAFEAAVAARGLLKRVAFVGVKPARAGFALGRLLVVPSLAESLPYIVLEAAAAAVPFIATRVGGIGEILGPHSAELVAAGDPAALARAIDQALREPAAKRLVGARIQARVREGFTIDAMTEAVLGAYADARAAHG